MVANIFRYTFTALTPSLYSDKHIEYDNWYDAVNHAVKHSMIQPNDRSVVFNTNGEIILYMRTVS